MNNCKTVEKDKQAFLNQHNAMKQAASMATKTHQEPCQNSSYNKANKKKNIFYVVDEDEYPTSATIVWRKDGKFRRKMPKENSSLFGLSLLAILPAYLTRRNTAVTISQRDMTRKSKKNSTKFFNDCVLHQTHKSNPTKVEFCQENQRLK